MPSSASTCSIMATDGAERPRLARQEEARRPRTAARAGDAAPAGKRRDRRGDGGSGSAGRRRRRSCRSRPRRGGPRARPPRAPSPTTSCERAPEARGDEADTAGVVLARRVERSAAEVAACRGSVRTGTGRVDPLPIGGHGASSSVAPRRPERPAGQKKSPLHLGAGRGSCACAARLPGRSRGADEIDKKASRGERRASCCIIMHRVHTSSAALPLTAPRADS